jgi:hypothetical protein
MRAPNASCGKAYWGEILRFENPAQSAEIRASVSGAGGMMVECRNVLRFAVDLGAGQYPDNTYVDLIVNQYNNPVMCPQLRRYAIGPVGQEPWLWKEDTDRPSGPVKQAGFEGPMCRVFCTDFAVVAASSLADTNMAAAAARITEAFSRAWRNRYGCDPIVVQEDDLADSMMQQRSLVVIGSPDTNSPLFKIVSTLPVRLAGQETVTVAGRRIEGPHIGFACVYPNPIAPRRLALWLGATSGTALARVLQACTFQRDFEVFRVNPEGVDGIVDEGWFDSNWSFPTPALKINPTGTEDAQ